MSATVLDSPGTGAAVTTEPRRSCVDTEFVEGGAGVHGLRPPRALAGRGILVVMGLHVGDAVRRATAAASISRSSASRRTEIEIAPRVWPGDSARPSSSARAPAYGAVCSARMSGQVPAAMASASISGSQGRSTSSTSARRAPQLVGEPHARSRYPGSHRRRVARTRPVGVAVDLLRCEGRRAA